MNCLIVLFCLDWCLLIFVVFDWLLDYLFCIAWSSVLILLFTLVVGLFDDFRYCLLLMFGCG